MHSDPLIQFRQVCKSFKSGDGSDLKVLERLDWEVSPGSRTAIVGPSGCGKSTILNLAGALDHPDSGEVLFEGSPLRSLSDDALAALRNEKIGFVFQSHHLLGHCTVWENILTPVLARQSSVPPEVQERAARLLDRVGLSGRLHHRPSQLSGGESQRVAVVRALILRPRLILADEPTGALDRDSALGLSRLLIELNQEEEAALVVVTHSEVLAREMGSILVLEAGRLRPVA